MGNKPVREEFKVPEFGSPQEAEDYIVECMNRVEDIEGQLRVRKTRAFDGELPAKEYWAWRTKALTAKAGITANMRMAKNWLRKASGLPTLEEERAKSWADRGLMRDLAEEVVGLIEELDDATPEEILLAVRAHEWLRKWAPGGETNERTGVGQ